MSSAKIRERIRLLRERTTTRGCTEAEALAAAEKVAQLMLDHGLTDGDLNFDEQSSRSKTKGGSPKAALLPVIAWCTNTAVIIVDGDDVQVSFVGIAPGPELAVYLREICERAIDRAVREFKKGTFYRRRRGLASKRASVNAFTAGMVGRLNARLKVVFGPAVSDEAYAEAARQLALRYPETERVAPPRLDLKNMAAVAEGWQAGESVTLAHGVGDSTAPLAIGGPA